jgi:hypothetical protein
VAMVVVASSSPCRDSSPKLSATRSCLPEAYDENGLPRMVARLVALRIALANGCHSVTLSAMLTPGYIGLHR